MRRLGVFGRSYGVDLLIVVGAIAAALEVALRHDPTRALPTPLWFAAPVAALIVLSLVGRRRRPFAAPVLVWPLIAALSFVDGRLVPSTFSVFIAGMAASFLLGQLADTVRGRLGLAVVIWGVAIVVYNDPNRGPVDFLFEPVLLAIIWLAGRALRERRTQVAMAEERATHAEREREATARIAVAEERARIARELHDIVAHAVSVMVLQVGAVRHRLPETLEQEKEALRGVEHAGRTALTEMRRLLGALRHDGDDLELVPQPGLGGLDSLLEEFERAGLPVRLHIDGEPFALPRGIDLSAYRIVQEGLTNALKHARASHANVLVRYGSDDLQVEVCDDGDGTSTDHGLGHGLIGVRERVTIYGGEMTAGSANAGGFALRTRLPLDGHRR